MSRLELIIGSMFSGKTSELIRRLNIEHSVKKNSVIYVNSAIDDRTIITHSTHNTTLNDKLPFDSVKTVSLMSKFATLMKYDVVGIDESHFFDDLETVVKQLFSNGKIIIVTGLNGDSMRSTFGQINQLISLATDLSLRKAVCINCHRHNATYSYRTSNVTDKTDVGGSNKYIALCSPCWDSLERLKKSG